MASSFDPGALLGASYPLDGGLRVRLRLARTSDVPAIRALIEEREGSVDEMQLARLVSFDPRTRVVLCATALVDSAETLVGVGAIECRDDGEHPEPELLIVSAGSRQELAELLAGALIGRAVQIAQAA